MSTIITNFFAGPGTGKSTTMGGVFYLLKSAGVRCEMATEYAKDKVWEKSTHTLDNQIYVFGKQHHRIWRLLDQVEVVITDSPLLLSLYYGNRESDTFKRLVLEEHNRLNNYNVFLAREKPFDPVGRLQNEAQAKAIDEELKSILAAAECTYESYPAVPSSAYTIADRIKTKLDAARSH